MRNAFIVLLLALGYAAAVAWVLFRPGRVRAGDDRIVLRLVHWQLESNVRDAFQAQLDRYMELNPHVRAEQVAVPGRVYAQWLRSHLTGGTATDIVQFGTFLPGLSDLVPRFFQPITRWVDQPNPYNKGTHHEGVAWRETFRDSMLNADGFHRDLNHYYAATLCSVTQRIFFNRELLRELTGLEAPPTEINAFLAVCDQIAAAGQERGIAPIASGLLNTKWTVNIIGGGILSRFALEHHHQHKLLPEIRARELGLAYLRGEWRHDSPSVRTYLELAREITARMRPGYLQLDRDDASQIFIRGQAVFISTGTWDEPSLRAFAPFEIGVARLPYPASDDPVFGSMLLGPHSDGAVNTTVALYLNKLTPHVPQAIDLLHFLTSVPGNQIFANKSSWYPSISGVVPANSDPNSAPDYDGVLLAPGISRLTGPDHEREWDNSIHLLLGQNGSVEAFNTALERTLRGAIASDLRREHLEALRQLRRLEPALIAQQMLEDLGASQPGPGGQPASEALLAGQVPYEIATFSLDADLRALGVLR